MYKLGGICEGTTGIMKDRTGLLSSSAPWPLSPLFYFVLPLVCPWDFETEDHIFCKGIILLH